MQTHSRDSQAGAGEGRTEPWVRFSWFAPFHWSRAGLSLWLAGGLLVAARATTWIVPGDFLTVQGALLATNKENQYIVQSGDSIAVGPGVHAPFGLAADPGRPRSRITFYSTDGTDNTVIDAGGAEWGIHVGVAGCTVNGFTIVNASAAGLALLGKNSYASHLRVENCKDGVRMDSSGSSEFDVGSQLVSSILCSNLNSGAVVGARCSLRDVLACYNRGSGVDFSSVVPGQAANAAMTDSCLCNNGWAGIAAGGARLTLTRNLVFGNLGAGMHRSPVGGLIYDNAFFSNGVPVLDLSPGCEYQVEKRAGPNIIGGPLIGGNYYDNYYGRDLDGDRLGDTRLPHEGVDAHPLLTDPPDWVDVAIHSFTAYHGTWGNWGLVSLELIVTNRGAYTVPDLPCVIRAWDSARDILLQTNLLSIEAGGTAEVILPFWDPSAWFASFTNLTAVTVADSTYGALAAITNLSVQARVDPNHDLAETNVANNLSPLRTLQYHVVPDLALRSLQLLQVNRHESMIKDRPMMARAVVALDESRANTMMQLSCWTNAMEIYPGRDRMSTNLFKELQGVQFSLRFNDGNARCSLTNQFLFNRDGALYAVPAERASAFRQVVNGAPAAFTNWLYWHGVDAVNFEYDPKANRPRPLGKAGSSLVATVEMLQQDASWTNDATNTTMKIEETSPVYRILFKALDSWTTSHSNTVAQHKLLMKRHCDFIEAIFPVVKVFAFYDDDDPLNQDKPPKDPETVFSFYAKMPTLAHKAGDWRRPENGGFLSTVYVLPCYAMGRDDAGLSYPHLGWGVFVHENYIRQLHLTAHEIFHTWEGRVREGYDKDNNIHWLQLAGDGWDTRGKLTENERGRFPGRARISRSPDLTQDAITWQTHMGDHLVGRPWITDENWRLLFEKMIVKRGVPLRSSRPSVASADPPSSRYLRLAGQVDAAGHLTLYPFYEVDGAEPEPTNGLYRVECLGADGSLLRPPVPFEPGTATVAFADESEPSQYFGLTVECPAETARLVFKQQALVLQEFAFSLHPPVVRDVQVVPQGDAPWQVRWLAEDPDGDALEFGLYYTADGTNWFPLSAEIAAAGSQFATTFRPSSKPGGPACKVAVAASDGVNRHRVESAPFAVPRKLPTAEILAPTPGDRFLKGDTVTFEGFAYDIDEGMLRGETFTWVSSRDGELGRGVDALRYSGLSLGSHTITLTVADQDGNTAHASVDIVVGAVRFEPPELAVSGGGGASNVLLFTGEDNQPWTLAADVPWIRLQSPLSGQGSATVEFEVLGQYRAEPRLGHLTADGAICAVTQAGLDDQDGNGFPDAWEQEHSLANLTPNSDADGDGALDLWECWAGTDPKNPQSAFAITGLSYSDPGQATLWWPSAPGRFYTVRGATVLPGPFLGIATNLLATPPENRFIDANQAPATFYRIELE